MADGVPRTAPRKTTVPTPLFAHHNIAQIYDAEKPVQLNGTVTAVQWKNPHAFVLVDVKDESGKVVNWKVELLAGLQLSREGFTRDSLHVGDPINMSACATGPAYVKPTVTSFVGTFLRPEMSDVYNQVNGLQRFKSIVVTRERREESLFPHGGVHLMHSHPMTMWERARVVNFTLP